MIKVSLLVFFILGKLWADTAPPIGVQIFPETSRPDLSLNFQDLTDVNGNKIKKETFKGKTSFLFFGFTHCPMICPSTLSILKTAFLDPKISKTAQVIFITVDPIRDTATRTKEYLEKFNPSFLGITGTKEKLSSLYGFFVKGRVAVLTDPSEHATLIYVVGPDSTFIGVIDPSVVSVPIQKRIEYFTSLKIH